MQMMPPGTSVMDPDAIMKAMLDPKNVGLARLAQVFGTFFLLFVPAVLYNLVCNGPDRFWLGFNNYINIYQVLIGFAIIYAANMFAAPIGDFSKAIVANFPSLDEMARKMEAAYNEQVLVLSNLRSWPEFLTAVVIMAFFPALFEEVFFRGGLQNILVRWTNRPIIAIIITSLLFSFIHMSIYLFLSRAILGFVLGLMYHKSKNIWVNVIAHFLNNAIAVAQLFWMSTRNKKIDVSALDTEVAWWVGLLALFVLIGLFYLLQKYSVANRNKINEKEAALYAKGNLHDPFTQRQI
jgi:membrane protease YdiL (CAAX protease family)